MCLVTKVYLLSDKDCKVVNMEFNQIHHQGHMEWTKGPMPFRFPVFVVWCTITNLDSSIWRKGRIVVNIHRLNQISITDAYLLLL